MRTVKNKSNQMFRDGDLVINPGEPVSVQDDRAEILLRDYAWQFEDAGDAEAPHENEIKAKTQGYQQPYTEVAATPTKPADTPDLASQTEVDAASSTEAVGPGTDAPRLDEEERDRESNNAKGTRKSRK